MVSLPKGYVFFCILTTPEQPIEILPPAWRWEDGARATERGPKNFLIAHHIEILVNFAIDSDEEEADVASQNQLLLMVDFCPLKRYIN